MAGSRNNPQAIPGVDTMLEAVADSPLSRPLVVGVIRAELQSLRKARSIPDHDEITGAIRQRLDDLALSRLQPVINGTGVVVHTNLGRSPMTPADAAGCINLEIDLVTGRRGGRAAYLEQCVAELCGAEAAMVVNNCAAALVLSVGHFAVKKKRDNCFAGRTGANRRRFSPFGNTRIERGETARDWRHQPHHNG